MSNNVLFRVRLQRCLNVLNATTNQQLGGDLSAKIAQRMNETLSQTHVL